MKTSIGLTLVSGVLCVCGFVYDDPYLSLASIGLSSILIAYFMNKKASQ